MPDVKVEAMRKLASKSSESAKLFSTIVEPIMSIPPFSLGYPSDLTQSAYYPGPNPMSEQEIALVSGLLERHSIYPENTRIRKELSSDHAQVFEVLQASVNQDDTAIHLTVENHDPSVKLVRGDHAKDLENVALSLEQAAKFAAHKGQEEYLLLCSASFRTGELETYRDSQRSWVQDKMPSVESIFGFVEPYRDPHGTRAEFEGLVAIMDPEETKTLARLVEHSDTFIRRLPWAGGEVNNGKGPFEKALFEPPDFTSIHSKCHINWQAIC